MNHSDHHNHYHIQQQDPTWSQYIDLVYGDNTSSQLHYHNYSSLQKHSNNFEYFYLNTNIKIISLSPIVKSKVTGLPSSNFIAYNNNNNNNNNNNQLENKLYKEKNQWMEVMRYKVGILFKDFDYEGYNAPRWPQFNYLNTTKVPYGCWFYSAPGSGIYINVGNVLVIMGKRKEIIKFFPEYLKANECIDGDDAKGCHDKYYCPAALSKGNNILKMIDDDDDDDDDKQ